MNFLINKFIEVLVSYGYKFRYEIQSNDVVVLYLTNLPPELDVKLLEQQYNYYDTRTKKLVIVHCCFPAPKNDNEICVILDKDTYANKINMIDGVIKEYRRKQYDKTVKGLKG